METSILDRLSRDLSLFPDRVAFRFFGAGSKKEDGITYRELAGRITATAMQLESAGLDGRTALLLYQESIEFIVSFFACLYCGIIAVPASYMRGSRQVSRLNNIISDAGAAAVLCNERTAGNLAALKDGSYGNIRVIITDESASMVDFHPLQSPRPEDTAFIQYSSGSTGRPKGIVISHKNLMHNQELLTDAFGCNEESRIFSWLPFHHDMGLIGNILHCIYTGASCVLMSPHEFTKRPKSWLEGITRYKITHSGGPNFAFDHCVDKIPASELQDLDLSSWIVAFNGSEVVRADTLSRFSRLFGPAGFKSTSFYPCYGLAEATLLVSGQKNNGIPSVIDVKEGLSIVSLGRIAEGMDCKIISGTDGRDCNDFEEGEVCISGDSVTSGYWRRSNEDLFCNREGKLFLRTGDLGFIIKGELYIHGRSKEMLIVRGQNIYPTDIETRIMDEHPVFSAVAVFTIDERSDAIVIVPEIKKSLLNELDIDIVIRAIDALAQGITGVEPLDVVLTGPSGLPRTTSGKLQRLLCREKYLGKEFVVIGSKLSLISRRNERVRDGTLLTAVMRNAGYEQVSEYLIDLISSKVDHFSAATANGNKSFQDFGIDSLRVMEITNVINKELNISLDSSVILNNDTISGLSRIIENLLWLQVKKQPGKEIII